MEVGLLRELEGVVGFEFVKFREYGRGFMDMGWWVVARNLGLDAYLVED